MREKTIYLHIGLPKTGTKWIQKILGSNHYKLRAHQLNYPIEIGEDPTSHKVIKPGAGFNVFSIDNDTNKVLDGFRVQEAESLLLSSEMMLSNILYANIHNFAKLEADLECLKNRGFTSIHFLILLRNPIDWIVSMTNQFIKTAQFDGLPTDDVYTNQSSNVFSHLTSLLSFLSQKEQVKLTILNYDFIKEDMCKPLEEWLTLPAETLDKPAFDRINRSLAYSELYALSKLTNVSNEKKQEIAFQWITKLPDIKPEKIYPSLEFQENYWRTYQIYFDQINNWLPSDQQLMYKSCRPFEKPDRLSFEYAQMDILFQCLTDSGSDRLVDNANHPTSKDTYFHQPAKSALLARLRRKLQSFFK